MMEFVVWLVALFMSILGVTYFYIKLCGFKGKFKKRFYICFLIGVIACTFVKYKEYTYLSLASYFILYPILFYVISGDKIKRIVYYTFIIWIYGALFDFLVMVLVSFGHLMFNFNINASWFKIVPTMLSLLFFFISANISPLRKFTNKLVNLLCDIKYSDILLISFFAFTVIGGTSIAVNINNVKVSVLIYILIALTIIIFIFIIHCKNVDYEFNVMAKTLKANNTFYTNIDNEFSMFKHNLMAKLLSVESYSNKKARELLKDLINDFNSNIDYHNLILDLPYGLDGVINQKLSNYSDKLDIKVVNALEHDIFDVLSPRRYNVLVEKLSLAIDNAIEASLNSVNKVLIINLMEEENAIKIEIKNTFKGTIDISNIGKIHYSTKGKKRGLGLYSILRNNEVSVKFKIINNYFVGELKARFKVK